MEKMNHKIDIILAELWNTLQEFAETLVSQEMLAQFVQRMYSFNSNHITDIERLTESLMSNVESTPYGKGSKCPKW